MRTALLTLALLVLGSTVEAQTLSYRWDYPIAALSALDRFELTVDGGQFNDVGIPATSNDARTLADHNTYRVPLTNFGMGPHTFNVRACTALSLCTTGTAFAYNLPGAPANLGVDVPPQQALAPVQALELAQSAAYWQRLMRLTDAEMITLIRQWPGGELTYGTVTAFLRGRE